MRSSRTDKVMGLLDGQESAKPANPVLKVPDTPQEYIPTVYTRSGSGTQLVNVNFLLINEQLGAAMERFHCCTCAVCAQMATAEVLRKLPPVIVTVKRKDDERTVNELAAKYRAGVTRLIATAVIGVKSNPPHGKKSDKQ